jgi:hypothetical protein
MGIVFSRPWKISMPLYRRMEKNAQLMEFKCVETAGKIKAGACPVAGELLSATVNRSVRLDFAGAANTDERSKAQFFLLGGARQPAHQAAGSVCPILD